MMIITKVGPVSLLILSLFALGGGKCDTPSPGNTNTDTTIPDGDGAPRKIDEDKDKEAEKVKKAQDEAKIFEKAAADAVAEAEKAVQAEEKNPSDPNHKAVDAAINKAQTALDQLKKNDLIDSALKDNLQKKLQDAANKHQQLNHSGTISFIVTGKGKKNLLLAGSDTPLNAKFSGKKPISCKWTSTFEAAKIANVVFADDKNCNTTVTATLKATDLSCMREFKIILNAGAPKPLEQSVSVTTKWCQFKNEISNPDSLPSNQTTKIVVRPETYGNDVWIGTKDQGLAQLDEANTKWVVYDNTSSSIQIHGKNVTHLITTPDGGIWFSSSNGTGEKIEMFPVGIPGSKPKSYPLSSGLGFAYTETVSHLSFVVPDKAHPTTFVPIVLIKASTLALNHKTENVLLSAYVFNPAISKFRILTDQPWPRSEHDYYSHDGFTSSVQWGDQLLLGFDAEAHSPLIVFMGNYLPKSALFEYNATASVYSTDRLKDYVGLEHPWNATITAKEDSNRRVTALASDKKKTLWMGFRPKELPPYLGGEGGLAVAITDANGNDLAAATTSWGFFEQSSSRLLSNHVFAIVVDKDDNAWIATKRGLNRATAEIKNDEAEIKKWLDFNQTDATKDYYIPATDIVDLAYRESDNTLWIATESNGVLKLHIDLLDP